MGRVPLARNHRTRPSGLAYVPIMQCLLCHADDAVLFATIDGRSYRRCPRCELTFLEPVQHPGHQQERAEYLLHENDPEDAGYRRFLSRAADPLTERLPPGSTVLDFGCGPGPALVRMLAERGYTASGWDPFFAEEAGLLQRTYDAVTCTETAEHFHDPRASLDLIDRLLRPGGWFALMTEPLTDLVDFPNWHYRRDATHTCFYRSATYDWLADHYGWRIEARPEPRVVLFRKTKSSSR